MKECPFRFGHAHRRWATATRQISDFNRSWLRIDFPACRGRDAAGTVFGESGFAGGVRVNAAQVRPLNGGGGEEGVDEALGVEGFDVLWGFAEADEFYGNV